MFIYLILTLTFVKAVLNGQPVLSMSVSDRLMQPWLYQACVVAVLNATLGNLTPINLMYRNAGNRYSLLANWSTHDPYVR